MGFFATDLLAVPALLVLCPNTRFWEIDRVGFYSLRSSAGIGMLLLVFLVAPGFFFTTERYFALERNCLEPLLRNSLWGAGLEFYYYSSGYSGGYSWLGSIPL